MSRTIPGLKAEIVDFQIKATPVTNPGEIVILLCDLPDQVTIADDNNPGDVIHLSVPANTPLLINGTTALKNLILGSELMEGLDSLVGNDRNLDIVNVLPMLSSELPLAVCKIVKRNGERPDTSDTKQLYEALEVAYEGLENYPAGFIVPLGVSIEDVVVKTANKISVDKYTGCAHVNNTSSILKNVEAGFVFEADAVEYLDKLTVKVDTEVTLMPSKSLKIKYTIFNGLTEIATYLDSNSINLLASESNSTVEKYYNLIKQVKPNGVLVSTPVNISDNNLLPLIQEDTIEASIALAKAEKGVLIIDPAYLTNGTVTRTYSKEIAIDGKKIATLSLSVDLEQSDAVTYNGFGYTVNWENIQLGEIAFKYITSELAPYTWYIGGTDFALKMSDGTAVATPVIYSAMNLPSRTLNGFTVNNLQTFLTQKGTVLLDRSAYTVEKFIKATETRSSENVLIDFVPNFNTYAVSALLNIENVVERDNVFYATINDEEIALSNIKNSKTGSKLFVIEDYILNYKDSLKIKLLAGLELPAEDSDFNLEITVVPASADFSKRAVDFCDYLTKQMNDCRVVMGVRPPKTTSPDDIKTQVTRVSNLLSNKSFPKGKLDNGSYLVVVSGAQKIDGYGGITDFAETKILSYDVATKKIVVDQSLSFVTGDKIDLIYTKKGKTIIDENIVVDIITTPDGYEVILKDEFTSAFLNTALITTRRVQISNAKDRTGSFLAALYAVTANNYGIDKAPFNVTLPGASEILYSMNQLTQLTNAKVTAITRNTFNTNGYIFDTPTLAGEVSDFQDQGTIGLVLYFIRSLRTIAGSRKGQRFGSADKQMIFTTELEAPFKAQTGKTITDYKLDVDFSKLNSSNELSVSFSIREAKKLKLVTITARLY